MAETEEKTAEKEELTDMQTKAENLPEAETEARVEEESLAAVENAEIATENAEKTEITEEGETGDGELNVVNVPEMLVEELSAEHNVARLADLIKIPKKVAIYIVAAAYFIVGVLCIAITHYISEALAYIVGSMMCVVGVGGFILSLIHRDYRDIKKNKLFTYVLCAALGVLIILEEVDAESNPIMMIAIVWGVFGLFEGAHAFNHAVTRIANSERCVYYIIKGIVECVVAFMLLYRPDSHEAHYFHIIVFGITLIIDSVTMIPKVKEFLTKF